MTTYEWWRVILASLTLIATLAVPFIMIWLERRYRLGLRNDDE